MIKRRFSSSAIEEAKQVYIYDITKTRKYVDGYTIDSFFSRDLDDGFSLKKKDDRYFLEVSIADVASVVKPGTSIYDEAFQRVETLYGKNQNDPMIPVVLSEEKLSLLPGHTCPSITFNIELKLDGSVSKFFIRETAFKSIGKLSYDQFDNVLSNDIKDEEYNTFYEMAYLANILLERRRNNGALAIYDIKKGIYTNEEGNIIPLNKEMAHISNIVVQEFMILTNCCLASYCAKNNIPVLFRNHTVRINAPDRKDIMDQINLVLSDSKFLNSMRSRASLWFNRADYGPRLMGHFGLNEPAYMHVTSPIRRIADLINHLVLKAFIHKQPYPFEFKQMEEMANIINLKILDHKRQSEEYFKEQAVFNSKILLNYSSEFDLCNMEAKEFTQVLKTAVVNNIILEPLENSLKERFKTKNLDANMLYLILFRSSKKNEQWLSLKGMASDYILNNSGLPVTIFNYLIQKNLIESFDSECTKSLDGFTAKTMIFIDSKLIKTPEYSFAKRKKDAIHKSAHDLLKLILNLPPESLKINDDIIDSEVLTESENTDFNDDPISYETEDSSFDNELFDSQLISPIEIKEGTNDIIEGTNDIIEGANDIIEIKTYKIDLNDDIKAKKILPEEIIRLQEHLKNSLPHNEPQSTLTEKKTDNQIPEKNYIGILLELCAKSKGLGAPDFDFSISGPPHSPIILCKAILITLDGIIEVECTGANKKEAKQIASQLILEKIQGIGLINNENDKQSNVEANDNKVGNLQEMCIKLKLPAPDYNFNHFGSPHEGSFECILSLNYKDINHKLIAYGSTKKTAKQNAAEKALKLITDQ